MQAQRTKLYDGKHAYVVIHDDQGVIGIEANNAVMGHKRIDLSGRVAKRVLAAFRDLPATSK